MSLRNATRATASSIWLWLCLVGAAGCGDDAGRDAGPDEPPDECSDCDASARERDGGGGTGGRPPIGGGTLDTGLPHDTLLSQLSDDEAQQTCEAMASAVGRQLSPDMAQQAACTLAAALELSLLGSADMPIDADECEQIVSECRQSGQAQRELFLCQDDRLDIDITDCDATIAQFEACSAAVISQVGTLALLLTCETLSDPSTADRAALEDMMHVGSFVECESIRRQCPDFDFGDRLSGPSPDSGCDNTCILSDDGVCDDGGSDADWSLCEPGTDCADCGERAG